MAESHVRQMGKHHDNKCTRCDERFYSRPELLNHIITKGHEGYICGHCAEVFDDQNKLFSHRKHCENKPTEGNVICDACGKTFSDKRGVTVHSKIQHGEKDPQTCSHCGLECNNKFHLKEHVRSKHLGRNATPTPCPLCGKGIKGGNMRNHTLVHHTPDHLMPFVCKQCHKGFPYKRHLEMHMNAHLGLKPFKCKYCEASFSDVSNRRMHERTTHEGYKRSKTSLT